MMAVQAAHFRRRFMATEKQIAANRANSKRSCGPKSKIGRLRSSRNAFRHGLSSALAQNTSGLEPIAMALAGNDANDELLNAARDIARFELELVRIRNVRCRMIMSLLEQGHQSPLKRLTALDRYERAALTKRKHASAIFGLLGEPGRGGITANFAKRSQSALHT
jgi:hypothetical protein